MQSFLQHVVQDLLKNADDFSKYTIILPSKRAGVFLKDEFRASIGGASMLPNIIGIEDFIEELSMMHSIDTTSLLFEFYHIYKQHTSKENLDTFDKFANWATILLQDFNEIDRHLIDPAYIFGYLKDVKRLDDLLKGEKKTDLINSQILFFENFEKYYTDLYTHLIEKKIGYQGLQYREAVENIHFYISNAGDTKIALVGFNALNKSEEYIFNELLDANIATIYWDVDAQFVNEKHSSSVFIRKYYQDWNHYKNNTLNWLSNHFSDKKNIKIIGAPKNTTQVKYASEILSELKHSTENYKNTALVLADESLLISTLNSLPKEVESVNITMGYDLKNIPLANLFEQLFKLHIHQKQQKFYHKNVRALLNQYHVIGLSRKTSATVDILSKISRNNFIYLTKSDLLNLSDQHEGFKAISFLFDNWEDNANLAIQHCLNLINLIVENLNVDHLEKEYLFRFHEIFQQLSNLNNDVGYITNIKSLHQFYKQVLQQEKLSFKGEPLSGLQIMGMLETRVLDFKNIIISSVNEGLLPSGRSDNSFIPFDIKKEVGLPTYQEKDAIFSYHFFRLLQRAENIYLMYNTEADDFGSGEQSRFLTQLEILKEEEVEKLIVSPKVNKSKSALKHLSKASIVDNELRHLAEKGISATALTTYILNPFDFYKQKILKINEVEEVEETVAANTLGTIIHKTLEALYIPFKGKYLTKESLEKLKPMVAAEVKKWFTETYSNGKINTGKNLLIYRVAQQFVSNFIDAELALITQGSKIKILELEYDLETSLDVESLDFPIRLRGQADRIDEIDGTLRIIDYKTGKVSQTELNIRNWVDITRDYKKYSKSFQVLFYALLYTRATKIDLDTIALESGIISFKNLRAGFLKVNQRAITEEDLRSFTDELIRLILEIYDVETPILEKEVNF